MVIDKSHSCRFAAPGMMKMGLTEEGETCVMALQAAVGCEAEHRPKLDDFAKRIEDSRI